ncbi:hypothetical protein [Tenggerimyces flavus]|uniref:Uncharacterized protein n=1 Tax=Tenggerimyces flavus TaxID=1708749 RepID=A0ABV7Y7U6_9ACTN|nr:hypothetical protein [Tenggerimyces flavus]MBM7786633.1 hypothetical protein [Tenggerimyces flavus]
MHGQLDAAGTLVILGNAHLRGLPWQDVGAFGSAHVFDFQHHLFRLDGNLSQPVHEWPTLLSAQGVRRCFLLLRPPSVGDVWKAGALGTEVLCLTAEGSIAFEVTFAPGPAEEPRIKQFVFGDGTRGPALTSPPDRSLDAAAAELDGALVAASEVASGLGLVDPWVATFAKARDALTTTPTLPLPSYSEQASRMHAAASAAWVFGAMGSWNDYVPLAGEPGKVTDRLYRACLNGFEAAVNEA